MTEIRICAREGCGRTVGPKCVKFCGMACKTAYAALQPGPCEQCREPFMPKHKAQRFCSVQCVRVSQSLEPMHCVRCGSLFKPESERSKYCSVDCSTNAKKTPAKACKHCNKLFHPRPGTVSFCTRTCADQHRSIPKAIVQQVIDLSREGLTPTEIAERLKISRNSVAGLRSRLDLAKPRREGRDPNSKHWKLALIDRPPEGLPPAFQNVARDRLMFGSEPLPPMHPISWEAIAL